MRLFMGLAVSPEAASELLELGHRAGIPEARWTPAENLHLTLYFFGEVAESRLSALRVALDHLHPVPVEVAVHSLGVFPRAGVLFAAVEPTAALARLQALVAGAVAAFAARPDPNSPPQGNYYPHITLARVRGLLRKDSGRLPSPASALRFVAHQVHLYRSTVGTSGSQYEIIHSTGTAARP